MSGALYFRYIQNLWDIKHYFVCQSISVYFVYISRNRIKLWLVVCFCRNSLPTMLLTPWDSWIRQDKFYNRCAAFVGSCTWADLWGYWWRRPHFPTGRWVKRPNWFSTLYTRKLGVWTHSFSRSSLSIYEKRGKGMTPLPIHTKRIIQRHFLACGLEQRKKCASFSPLSGGTRWRSLLEKCSIDIMLIRPNSVTITTIMTLWILQVQGR